jgi:hypothetical protein
MSIRVYAIVFAIVLAFQSVWLLAAEITRPALPFFPANRADADAAASRETTAATSAWIGWPRGTLWVDYAMSANAPTIGQMMEGVAAGRGHPSNAAQSTAQTAAAISPSDARAWLLLAANNMQSHATVGPALAQLKMSYYTAPYSERLFPLRVQVAARSPSSPDNELLGLIEYELRLSLRAKPDLKHPIAQAYRNGSPAGRRLLEDLIGALDPKLSSELRTSAR